MTVTPEHQLIALSGYAGAGKDTAAAALVADGWKRVAFADKLRDLALLIDPMIGHDLTPGGHHSTYECLSDLVKRDGWDAAKKIPEVRRLLQDLGAGVRQVLGENVWVDAAMSDLPDGNVVITDCRYPNEARAVRDAGGHVIRVKRPGVEAVNGHDSETALNGWGFDAYLRNDEDEAAAGESLRRIVAGFATP